VSAFSPFVFRFHSHELCDVVNYQVLALGSERYLSVF
jgi:hypothetical protein